ncbi:MAG TPA: hypothetical protein VK673_20305, partial [Chthoniobacterales bacterium]|nr:hypothetical protein [Chthoniobacterales bacterium]
MKRYQRASSQFGFRSAWETTAWRQPQRNRWDEFRWPEESLNQCRDRGTPSEPATNGCRSKTSERCPATLQLDLTIFVLARADALCIGVSA